jgi:N6-adenosine-specific RNA methylase IME4
MQNKPIITDCETSSRFAAVGVFIDDLDNQFLLNLRQLGALLDDPDQPNTIIDNYCLPAPDRGRFAAIVAGPPWPFATYSDKGKGRSPEAWYDTMPLDAIKALPVAQWATDDTALFVPDGHFEHGLEVIRGWSFTFKPVAFFSVKIFPLPDQTLFGSLPLRFPIGIGFWTRANPEMCLLGTKDRPQRRADDVPKLLLAPRREHSRKPDERVERLVRGPYPELFARDGPITRPGWTRWVGKAGRDRAPLAVEQPSGGAQCDGPAHPPRCQAELDIGRWLAMGRAGYHAVVDAFNRGEISESELKATGHARGYSHGRDQALPDRTRCPPGGAKGGVTGDAA